MNTSLYTSHYSTQPRDLFEASKDTGDNPFTNPVYDFNAEKLHKESEKNEDIHTDIHTQDERKKFYSIAEICTGIALFTLSCAAVAFIIYALGSLRIHRIIKLTAFCGTVGALFGSFGGIIWFFYETRQEKAAFLSL